MRTPCPQIADKGNGQSVRKLRTKSPSANCGHNYRQAICLFLACFFERPKAKTFAANRKRLRLGCAAAERSRPLSISLPRSARPRIICQSYERKGRLSWQRGISFERTNEKRINRSR